MVKKISRSLKKNRRSRKKRSLKKRSRKKRSLKKYNKKNLKKKSKKKSNKNIEKNIYNRRKNIKKGGAATDDLETTKETYIIKTLDNGAVEIKQIKRLNENDDLKNTWKIYKNGKQQTVYENVDTGDKWIEFKDENTGNLYYHNGKKSSWTLPLETQQGGADRIREWEHNPMRNSSKNKSKKQKQTEYVQKEKEKKKKIFKSLGRYHNKLPRNNRMPKTLNQQSKKNVLI